MNNDKWTPRLSEYIDGQLGQGERDALEQHLAGCDECREDMALLRRVRMRAGALEDRPPQVDLWPGIAVRIGVHTGSYRAAPRRLRRQWTFTVPQLAAAALALVALGAGGVWFSTARPPATVEAVAPDPTLVPVGFEARGVGVVSYDAAIADLEQVLSVNRDRLDTTTVRVLEESLILIDRAITRAREALEADPSDAYLNTHLAETMRRKLALLRRAADIAFASS